MNIIAIIFFWFISTILPLNTNSACILGGNCYPTIQEAIDYSSLGDIINVAPGIYEENLIIVSDLLSIVGAVAPGETVVIPNNTLSPTITTYGGSIALHNLSVYTHNQGINHVNGTLKLNWIRIQVY